MPNTIELTIHASVLPPFNIGGGNPPVTNAETFDGTIPRQPITLQVGDTLIVRLINDLPFPTGIHWHGLELENYSDGTEVTQNEVIGGPIVNGLVTGGTYLYKFKAPKPGIFWFHPHHHHSTNRAFRGQYGMIIVKDTPAIEAALAPILPTVANTYTLGLSDITVCKSPNDTLTYQPPVAGSPEWLSGQTSQNGPTPIQLCTAPTRLDDEGMAVGPGGGDLSPGEIPNIFNMTPGLTVEGQTVLTNGVNVGGRAGTPLLPIGPGALDPGYLHINAEEGDGLRFQIANMATTRYFRLILTTAAGVQVNLIRIGGEGGILNDAILEGGMLGTYDTKYSQGEILIPPGSRADVVAVVPPGTMNTTMTMWTRDFQRTGAGWSRLPTVPVLHIDVGSTPVTPFVFGPGTALKSAISPTLPLGAPTNAVPFLTPGNFIPAKLGAPSANIATQDIELAATAGVNGINTIAGVPVAGSFDMMPYTDNPHIESTRYAVAGDILLFRVVNTTNAHHPFHLHGFSFHPVTLETNTATLLYTWPANATEFRDNFDVPAGHTVTFKVHISDRELADGLTSGGAYGRWLFHCHIFFHAHHGMISELVITDPNGNEKPNVSVHGSWAYAPKPGIATRTGTYFDRDLDTVTLTSHLDTGAPFGAITWTGTSSGDWSWILDTEAPPATAIGIYYVYISAVDSNGLRDQAVFRLKIGTPDDGSDNGDPHIHTVDGKYYDFQAAGEFILLRDRDGFEVQARQTPILTANPITDWYSGLKSCVSLNTAAAARVGRHRIAYMPGRETGSYQFYVDGKPANLTSRGMNLDGHSVSGFDVNGVTAMRVDYLNHAVLIVTPMFWSTNNVWYLNISVYHTYADEGIMGPILPGNWLPQLRSGAGVGPMPASLDDRFNMLYKTFADSWRVTDETSLFVYAPGTSTSTFTDRDWPARDLPCTLKREFEIPGWVIPLGMDEEKARDICSIVTDEGLNRDCVFDVATTGDAEFARAYQITQQVRERGTAVQIIATKPTEITAIVSGWVGERSTPRGTVAFFIDERQVSDRMSTDSKGRVVWNVTGVEKGTWDIKAFFTPDDELVDAPGCSPYLRITSEGETGRTGGGGTGGTPTTGGGNSIFRRWYFWALILLIILLLLWWLL